MFKKALLAVAVLLLAATQTKAQMMPNLPIDPDVKVGTLKNGLTYYVRHNALPEKQAFFYIAQKVGSVQEEESQRGLAHFLEHMAFNGSDNFAPGELVSYCEKIGVKFGRDLNAYTSTDETVYNIDNVPVSEANIDSCLLILHDWSSFLTLAPEEIDKERGVIHEEWRLRSSGMQRMLNRNLEKLYPGSRYGKRMPIGLMSVVDNFTPSELHAYYKKWYRPDLQAIIVVGDIDVDQIVGKIEKLFGDIKNPENEAEYVSYPVPSTPEPIYVIDKDKEQQAGVIWTMWKSDPLPEEYRGSMALLMQNYVNYLLSNAINTRLDELTKQADCPFNSAGVYYGTYILSKTMDAFSLDVQPKPGKDKEALQVAMQEIERVKRYGFTDSEILRADEKFLSSIESQYNNRDKQRSPYYVRQYVRHFEEGDAIPSLETEYQTYKMLSQQLRGAGQLTPIVTEAFKQYTAQTDSNFVVAAFYPEKEGVNIPTESDFAAAIAAAKAADLEPYVDNVKNEPLVPVLPKAGKIKKEESADFGYTKWTLSNGCVVYAKKTDFNDSQVLMSAQSWGGYNELNISTRKNMKNAELAADVCGSTGLGNFTATELDKALAGKQARVRANISNDHEGLSGSSTPKDLRTLFELTYLYFTNQGNDPESFRNFCESMKTQLENAEKVPETAFQDSLYATLYPGDIRAQRTTAADIDLLDYDLMKQIMKERFASPSDFTFFFTGAFNEDSLRLFCEQYLASIPAAKSEAKRNPKMEMADGPRENRFTRAMQTPKSIIIKLWHNDDAFNLKEREVVNAYGSILSQRLLKSIREEAGFAYSAGGSAGLSRGWKDEYTVQAYVPVRPAKCDSALLLMDQDMKNMATTGVTAEELNKVKEYELKSFADNQKQNNYWAGLIQNKVFWGIDTRTGREDAIKSVTTDDVRKFAARVLSDNNWLSVIMLPESFEESDD